MTEDANDDLALVVTAIVEATDTLHGQGADNATWSKTILRSIASRGHARRYYVCGTGLRQEGLGSHGEWLFDQTWYACQTVERSGAITFDPHKLEHLALALECEWLTSEADVIDDFAKLAVSVAETRVMIFEADDLEGAVARCWTMMDAARRIRTGTDADYLFAAYVREFADRLPAPILAPNPTSYPFRFWRARLKGPLVPIPPA